MSDNGHGQPIIQPPTITVTLTGEQAHILAAATWLQQQGLIILEADEMPDKIAMTTFVPAPAEPGEIVDEDWRPYIYFAWCSNCQITAEINETQAKDWVENPDVCPSCDKPTNFMIERLNIKTNVSEIIEVWPNEG